MKNTYLTGNYTPVEQELTAFDLQIISELATAEFVVLDAQDFARGYVARVLLPQRIPFGFHGNWVSDDQVHPQES